MQLHDAQAMVVDRLERLGAIFSFQLMSCPGSINAVGSKLALGKMDGRQRYTLILSLALLGIFIVFYHTTAVTTFQDAAASDFIETKFDFQEDLRSLKFPKLDLADFKDYPPHHFVANSSTPQDTFATFLCTRNGSLQDPYFAASLNLVYRNLWSPTIASKIRSFTVFVAPFVTQEQRDILAGAGAVIQELPLVLWKPNTSGTYDRWRDQFSKLHFWYQTQYSRIAFMDSDAFPIVNIDEVFDEATEQKCDSSKMTLEDWAQPDKEGWCEYVFSGVGDLRGGVHGGFFVLKPNRALHQRLLREYPKDDQYDNILAEQSFFKWHFAADGPFPAQILPRKYNAYFPSEKDEGEVSIVHEKLWSSDVKRASWLNGIWEDGWKEMIEFFDSDVFIEFREQDLKASDPPPPHIVSAPEFALVASNH